MVVCLDLSDPGSLAAASDTWLGAVRAKLTATYAVRRCQRQQRLMLRRSTATTVQTRWQPVSKHAPHTHVTRQAFERKGLQLPEQLRARARARLGAGHEDAAAIDVTGALVKGGTAEVYCLHVPQPLSAVCSI